MGVWDIYKETIQGNVLQNFNPFRFDITRSVSCKRVLILYLDFFWATKKGKESQTLDAR